MLGNEFVNNKDSIFASRSLVEETMTERWYACRQGAQLKALDTFGSFQRPVFSLGASQHYVQITTFWKFGLNWSSKLQANKEEEKITNIAQLYVLSDA